MLFDFTTLAIIGVTVLISLQGFKDGVFFNRYKFNPVAVEKARQWERFLTAGLLHVDFNHLLFNMLTLFFFAPIAINEFGVVGAIVLYITAILVGNALAFWENRGNGYYNAVGASGGVSGILFAAILLFPQNLLYIFFAIPVPAWIVGIVYLGYSIFGMRNRQDNIGHSAHLGGALAGIIPTLVLNPELFTGPNQFYTIGILIPIVGFFIWILRGGK